VSGVGQEDLVSMLDIAHRVKRTREAVRLWATGKRGPGDFPEPAWRSRSGERFWSWPEVAQWVSVNLNLAVDVSPAEIRWADEIVKARNAVSGARRILDDADAATQQQFRPLLDEACA
jgi:hypothetical protein